MSQTLKTSLEKIPFENVCNCSVTTDTLNSLISWIKGVACSNNASTWSTFLPCYWLIGASASNKSRGIAWIDLSWPIENRIECNSSLDHAPIIEGAAGAFKICIGRLYRVSGSWFKLTNQIWFSFSEWQRWQIWSESKSSCRQWIETWHLGGIQE